MSVMGSAGMAEIQAILESQIAFKAYVRENYADHPVGGLILALQFYEGCRQHSDSFFWEIMGTQGKGWTSQSFLNAAYLVIAVSRGEK